MTPESTESITLKIWDRSAIFSTLEGVVQELATRAGTTKDSVVVGRSGPDTFTVRLIGDSYPDPLQEVPC
jgi:hypothetical protein